MPFMFQEEIGPEEITAVVLAHVAARRGLTIPPGVRIQTVGVEQGMTFRFFDGAEPKVVVSCSPSGSFVGGREETLAQGTVVREDRVSAYTVDLPKL